MLGRWRQGRLPEASRPAATPPEAKGVVCVRKAGGELAAEAPLPDGRGLRVAVVTSRFNSAVTSRLRDGAIAALQAAGVAAGDLTTCSVPGAFELPATARRLARSGQFDAVVCLGAVIRGETDHYAYVCQSVTDGLTRLAQDAADWGQHGVALSFGVLTTADVAQALARAGGPAGNKGADAALAALEVARLWQTLPAPAADGPH
jgi:6,7-dimethyl-8-ribityllumazine synthase